MDGVIAPIRHVVDDREAFRDAVEQQSPYKPLYVKFKLFFGCNLR